MKELTADDAPTFNASRARFQVIRGFDLEDDVCCGPLNKLNIISLLTNVMHSLSFVLVFSLRMISRACPRLLRIAHRSPLSRRPPRPCSIKRTPSSRSRRPLHSLKHSSLPITRTNLDRRNRP